MITHTFGPEIVAAHDGRTCTVEFCGVPPCPGIAHEVRLLPATDTVNHPSHYGGDTTYEAIKVIEAWGLGFTLGNAVKYICRAGAKGNAVEDLKKAVWYVQHEADRLEQAGTERQLNLAQGGPVKTGTAYLVGARPDRTPDTGTVALSDLVAYLERAAQYNAERAAEHDKRGRTTEAEQNNRARWAYDDAARKLRTALGAALVDLSGAGE